MRHILIDHIRARQSEKRGARRTRVPLTDDLQLVDPPKADIIDLDRALDELAAFDPRKAELVELCAFLGCGRGEAADLLGISLATARRDFRVARDWALPTPPAQHRRRRLIPGHRQHRQDRFGPQNTQRTQMPRRFVATRSSRATIRQKFWRRAPERPPRPRSPESHGMLTST
jgi:hypothetical protein